MSDKENINLDVNISRKVLKQIRSMMREDGINIKNLSSKLGVSVSSLSGLLRQDNISLNKLADICNTLGYNLNITVSRSHDDILAKKWRCTMKNFKNFKSHIQDTTNVTLFVSLLEQYHEWLHAPEEE